MVIAWLYRLSIFFLFHFLDTLRIHDVKPPWQVDHDNLKIYNLFSGINAALLYSIHSRRNSRFLREKSTICTRNRLIPGHFTMWNHCDRSTMTLSKYSTNFREPMRPSYTVRTCSRRSEHTYLERKEHHLQKKLVDSRTCQKVTTWNHRDRPTMTLSKYTTFFREQCGPLI